MKLQLEHKPAEGECPVTIEFLKHIFQHDYELGLDYIQLLYQQPTKNLPILCLVSKEKNTCKGTFLKLIKAIFGQNATVIGNEDLANGFYASWAEKLVIAIDETFVYKKAQSSA